MFGFLSSYPTGMPVIDAQDDYRRARRAQITARLGHCLTGRWRRRHQPRALEDEPAMVAGTTRLEVVELRAIVGTLETKTGFDVRFRPASDVVRRRWERIALAHRTGTALPPITLLRCPDGYYVVDGCHRVSVARALGHRDIDAWVRTSDLAASGGRMHPDAEREEMVCA